jgi:HTH-type transcriptional regulator/antitoxin MqsA
MSDRKEYLANCPVCGGTLVVESRNVRISYKGESTDIEQPGEYCTLCDEGFLSPNDITSTRKSITDFHRKVDNLLTSSEVKSARSKLNLSQKAAGEIFGGGPMAFSKYERGEITQNKSTDRLLRLLVNGKVKIKDIQEFDEEELKEM